MRKVTFGGAISFNGHLARKDGEVDWLMWSDEAAEIMNDHWPRVDTILMGRKTYEVAVKSNPPNEVADTPDGGMKTYVFSRTIDPDSLRGAEVVSENASDFVRRLKQQDGKDICIMGGGDLARSLLEAGVIDEIGFNIHPVLLGSGIPAFHVLDRQIDLELTECRQFKNGCVYLQYRVKN